MAYLFDMQSREAVRVKVKKCEGMLQPECKKFSVDPQITSFEVLQSLLMRAFSITGDFAISYLTKDDCGRELYLSLLSDWDLDAAFLSASDPCLVLKVDTKPFEEGLEDWDMIQQMDMPRTVQFPNFAMPDRQALAGITGSILTHVGKTVTKMGRTLGFGGDAEVRSLRPPVSDQELRECFMDPIGHLHAPQELRLAVYLGGVEPQLRKVIWRHLLNVCPANFSGSQRYEYMKQKKEEYYKLRDIWKKQFIDAQMSDEVKYITNLVRKDVLRTDRSLPFYAGADDNKNVMALFNILTTYAYTHPEVCYCQGMSDIASPLLVTMKDEAYAYICFCGLMKRLRPNFLLDGVAMTQKFQHLSELLQHLDPTFYEYLKHQGADDLLFCYRWLLLELKREFAFEDALYMLEVMWSTIPPDPPDSELQLADPNFEDVHQSSSSSPLSLKENPYTRLRAIRRQTSASSSPIVKEAPANVLSPDQCCLQKFQPDDDEELETETAISTLEYRALTNAMTRQLRTELSSLNHSIATDERLDVNTPISPCDEEFCGFINSPKTCDEEERSENAIMDESQEIIFHHRNDSGSPSRNSFPMSKVKVKMQSNQMNVDTDLDSRKLTDNMKRNCAGFDCNEEEEELYNGETVESVKEAGEPYRELKVVNMHSSAMVDQTKPNAKMNNEDKNLYSDSTNDKPSSSGSKIHRPSSLGNLKKFFSDRLHDMVSPSKPEADMQPLSSSTEMGISANSYEKMESESEQSLSSDFESLNFGENLRPLCPPEEFGGGNPFLMFLCLTLLLQHRIYIMKNKMDYNEIAMHFDKMVRSHDVHRVLQAARTMYSEYLKQWRSERESSRNAAELTNTKTNFPGLQCL